MCSVVDHGLVFAMHRNPNKQPKSLVNYRRLRIAPFRLTSYTENGVMMPFSRRRLLRFPQSGIETCTFDVFFPLKMSDEI